MSAEARTFCKDAVLPLQGRDVGLQGALILNADDWGLDRETTDRINECVASKVLSSVSAMVFMEDSTRAATMAREAGVDAGLHLNFTAPFSAKGTPNKLAEHQFRLMKYLRGSRLNQVIFHPGLANSFQYVTQAQLAEFNRIYGSAPLRLDGHHHMHLCANVIFGKLLPAGTMVRRNFSFQPGEKSLMNRKYREFVDRRLTRRHSLTDYLYSLAPLESRERVQRVFSLSRHSLVEVETHPAVKEEQRFLIAGEFLRFVHDLPLATHYIARAHGN